uniref:Uncharacterized protein n=1 Tax=Rhizophora mucronata TaxID=61149 RepID=A0A2P2NBM8_RHIMU
MPAALLVAAFHESFFKTISPLFGIFLCFFQSFSLFKLLKL